jgi:tRNA (guanine37-N1)-methyltransferase
MKFAVISIFPEMLKAALSEGIVGTSDKIEITFTNLRDFTDDNHKSVDDKPFGGGDGMVMRPEVLGPAILAAKEKLPNAKVIYLSPQGKKFTQKMARELVGCEELILLSGRYAGVDQRVLNTLVDEEISIGDYILSGGELPALVLIDAIGRLVPGVLGNKDSAKLDSFSSEENVLEAPLFTRPRQWNGQEVPAVLLSGDHGKIKEFQKWAGVVSTYLKRPDLLDGK